MELQGFQLFPLLQAIFSHKDDRLLLSYLFPMSPSPTRIPEAVYPTADAYVFFFLALLFLAEPLLLGELRAGIMFVLVRLFLFSPKHPTYGCCCFAVVRLGCSAFFQQAIAVSANRFRPPIAGATRGFGGGRMLLHPRTQQLQDILRLNEKLRFALNVLKHPDPLAAIKDPSQWAALFTGAEPSAGNDKKQQHQQLAPEQQQLLQEFVEQHAAGGGRWLSTYALQLQLKLNEIVDSSRAEKP